MRTCLLHVKNFLLTVSAFSVLLAAVTIVSAQYQIESWTTGNGLPQNTVHSIVQTPEGYLWLATLEVLCVTTACAFRFSTKATLKASKATALLIWRLTVKAICERERKAAELHVGIKANFKHMARERI